MKVRLLCEGNWDGRVGRRDQCEGAAVVILRRLVGDDHEIEPQRLPKLTRGGGLERKIVLAIAGAEDDPDCDALVVLVDRDKPEYGGRLKALEAGIEKSMGKKIAAHTVAGMPIEELEAWLIASSKPLGNDHLDVQAASKPEKEPDPKQVFHEMLGKAGMPFAVGYDLAARVMDFDEVESKCKAFRHFRAQVASKID